MRKQLLILLLLSCFITGTINAQRKIVKPDYKKIEKAISKKKSAEYYPKLFNRYQNNDTTLTDDDYTLLLYGSTLQSGYYPYALSPYSDSTARIFDKSTLTLADYDSAINLETTGLKLKPFSLRDLNILAYSYLKTGDDSLSNLINYKKERIIKTILSTGDGKTQETGFFVTNLTQEYDILQILSFEFSGEQTPTPTGCDYLGVKENKYHIKGLFFDANRMREVEKNLSTINH
jgi:hypothetical protein